MDNQRFLNVCGCYVQMPQLANAYTPGIWMAWSTMAVLTSRMAHLGVWSVVVARATMAICLTGGAGATVEKPLVSERWGLAVMWSNKERRGLFTAQLLAWTRQPMSAQ